MTKIIATIALIFTFTTCVTQKATISAADYWAKAPDLTRVTYEGGDGKTIETAVIVKNAENERNGVASEYAFIAKIHGEKFKGPITNEKSGPSL